MVALFGRSFATLISSWYVCTILLCSVFLFPFLAGEERKLPPSPLLILYSDHGVLCPYTVVNTGCHLDDFAKLVKPPKPLPSEPPRRPVSQPGGHPPQLGSELQHMFPSESVPFGVQQHSVVSSNAAFGALPAMRSSLQAHPSTTTTSSGLFSLSSVPSTKVLSQPGPFSGIHSLGGGGKLESSADTKQSFPFNVGSIVGGGQPSSQRVGTLAVGEIQPPPSGLGFASSVGTSFGSALGSSTPSQVQASTQPQQASGIFSQRLLATVSQSKQIQASITPMLASQAQSTGPVPKLLYSTLSTPLGPPRQLPGQTPPGVDALSSQPPPTTLASQAQSAGRSKLLDSTPLGQPMQLPGITHPGMGAPFSRPLPPYPFSSSATQRQPPSASNVGGLPPVSAPPNVVISQRISEQQPPRAPLGPTISSAAVAPSPIGNRSIPYVHQCVCVCPCSKEFTFQSFDQY